MRWSAIGAAVVVMFASLPAYAQIRGLGSASLPYRPEVSAAPPDHQVLSQPVAPGFDVFRARPDTYVPSRHHQPYFFPVAWVPPIYGFVDPRYAQPPIERPRMPELEPRVVPREPPAERRAVDIPPQPLHVPAKPKTFYVIPGCYAGDRPPDVERLPSGCDPAKLRVIPPTTP